MPNFSSLARLEVPEKFVWVVVGGVCKVIFMVNPTIVLRLGLGWGFDNKSNKLGQRQSQTPISIAFWSVLHHRTIKVDI